MITPTKAFQTSDGQTFADIEGAQGQELKLLLTPCGDCSAAISILVVQREKVIDILSTTATSKPRARAINGGRKKRKAANNAQLPGTTT